MNDMACFSIQQLGKLVQDKDKESKKIYGALLKRSGEYQRTIDKIVDNKMDYYCDYCTEMDSICDDAYFEFKTSLKNAYSNANIDDYEYISQVEIMRSMVELSVEAGKRVIYDATKVLKQADFLKNYLIVDMLRVANNFSKWAYRKIDNNVKVDLNEDGEVMTNFRKLSECLIDYYSFDKAYRESVKLEIERNNNG